MIATPSEASCRTILNSVSHSDDDSAEVGSSMIRMRASSDSALAISTSCCSPIRNSAPRQSGSLEHPLRRPDNAATIDQRAGDQRLAAEEDVVGDAQFGDEVELLMNDRHTGRLGV